MDPNTELFSKLSKRMRVVEGPGAETCVLRRSRACTEAHGLQRSASTHVQRRRLTMPPAFSDSTDADDSIRPDRKPLRRVRRVQVPAAFTEEGSEGRPRIPSSQLPVLSHSQSSPPTFRSFPHCIQAPKKISVAGSPKTAPVAEEPKISSKADVFHEQLLRLVDKAEAERAVAQRETLAAEEGAAARGAELREEVLRLRERAVSLKEGLSAAKADEGFFEEEGLAVRARRSSWEVKRTINGTSRQHMLDQTEHLAAKLEEGSSNCTDLYNRLQSLEVEFQNQVTERRRLHEQIQASRNATAEGQKELEVLLFGAAVEEDSGLCSDGGTDESEELVERPLLLSPGRSDGGGLFSARASVALPSENHLFDLTQRRRSSQIMAGGALAQSDVDVGADDDEDRTPSSSSRSSAFGDPEMGDASRHALGDDLEFAYEWGLEMSNRMPVAHALKLALWASRSRRRGTVDEGEEQFASHKHGSTDVKESGEDAGGGTPSLSPSCNAADSADLDDEDFLAPLAELQDALAVLQRVSSQRSAGVEDHIEETSSSMEAEVGGFDAAIADLQRAIAQMSPSQRAEQDPPKPSTLNLNDQPKFSLFDGQWTDMDAPGQHISVIEGETLRIFDGTLSRVQILAADRISAHIAGNTYSGILHDDGLLRWDFGGVWRRL